MVKSLPIIKNPAESLRRRSAEIKTEQISTANYGELCSDMTATMLEKDGVGLAAPQVGKNIRLIVINTKDGPLCLFNPQIFKKSIIKEWGEEGCLSVPGIFGQVKRCRRISYSYYDLSGRKISAAAKGFLARVIQHEIDHLDGVLFIDKAEKLKKVDNEF